MALFVGTWLTSFNEGHQLWVGPWDAALAIKIVMNLLTPFVVANLGLVSRQGELAVVTAERNALDASRLPQQAIEACAASNTPMKD